MAGVDMSPEAVERRLREASRLSVLRLHYPPRVDMSPQEVERRLREVAQLYALERRLRALGAAQPGPTASK
jgi:hypothetical protein